MIALVLMTQAVVTDLAPSLMEPVAATSWACTILAEDRPFRLFGRAPAFPAERVEGQSVATEVLSNVPAWSTGAYRIAVEASGEDFRRYILTRAAPDGSEFLFDMVLLRGAMGIATLTDVSKSGRNSPRTHKLLAKGYCEVSPSQPQEGS